VSRTDDAGAMEERVNPQVPLWDVFMTRVRRRVDRHNFCMWFRDIEVNRGEGVEIEVWARDAYTRDVIDGGFRHCLDEIAIELLGTGARTTVHAVPVSL
jgi:hypothetical protein